MPDAPTVASVQVSPVGPVLGGAGSTAQLGATALTASGAPIHGRTFVWTSSDPLVASVDANGLVTAEGPTGDALVSARTEGVSGSTAVLVRVGAAGGLVRYAGGTVELVFRPGAVSAPLQITADPASGLPEPERIVAGTAFDLGPDGTVFPQAVTLTLAYDDDDLPQDVEASDLAIHHLIGDDWVAIPSDVDATAYTVSARIAGFSIYALLGPPAVRVLLPSQSCADYSADAIATFADSNLVAAVRAALQVDHQEPLTCGLLATLTSLTAQSSNIQSVAGIQNLPNLTGLYLFDQPLTDIAPIGSLTHLTALDLSVTSISDISPLGALTNLTWLRVGNGAVTDIGALSSLVNLTTLDLNHNLITDVSALAGLTSLRTLRVRGRGAFLSSQLITDVSPLAGLTGLTELRIGQNAVTDLSPLAGLTQLTAFTFGYNAVADISAVAAMTQLTEVRFDQNQVSDISALSGLTQLTHVLIGTNPIADITPLANLTVLEVLELQQTPVTDIGPLSGLGALRTVYLSGNRGLANIQPLIVNPGIGSGDEIWVTGTAVSCADVLALQAKGPTVVSDCASNPAPTSLSFSVQPSDVAAGAAISPDVVESQKIHLTFPSGHSSYGWNTELFTEGVAWLDRIFGEPSR